MRDPIQNHLYIYISWFLNKFRCLCIMAARRSGAWSGWAGPNKMHSISVSPPTNLSSRTTAASDGSNGNTLSWMKRSILRTSSHNVGSCCLTLRRWAGCCWQELPFRIIWWSSGHWCTSWCRMFLNLTGVLRFLYISEAELLYYSVLPSSVRTRENNLLSSKITKPKSIGSYYYTMRSIWPLRSETIIYIQWIQKL